MTPLSGSIPGLLRACSPVLMDGDTYSGIVIHPLFMGEFCVYSHEYAVRRYYPADRLTLDTSDPTGAFHARLWAGDDPERLRMIREAGVE